MVLYQTWEGNMNFFHALPLIFACTLAIPAVAQNLNKDFYSFPETLQKKIYISHNNNKLTTFVFQVNSLIGTAKNIKMTAKVVGNPIIAPVPQSATFPQIQEGDKIAYKFVLPITEEQAKDRSLKIQGTVEYLPDYDAMLEYVKEDPQHLYTNEFGKNKLINNIEFTKKKQLISTEVIRFDPGKPDKK